VEQYVEIGCERVLVGEKISWDDILEDENAKQG